MPDDRILGTEWGSDRRGLPLPVADEMESLFNSTFDHRGYDYEYDYENRLGRVLCRWDHYESGPDLIVAEVPVYESRTLFARFGHWPWLVTAVVCVVFAGRMRYDANIGWFREIIR